MPRKVRRLMLAMIPASLYVGVDSSLFDGLRYEEPVTRTYKQM
ncbi:MAG TPA: hypothetical protein VHT73_16195 [Thermodesulfobacteriota bacterium]|nr:hypothetical protein [Thermodesulfobacteriota bacterium]